MANSKLILWDETAPSEFDSDYSRLVHFTATDLTVAIVPAPAAGWLMGLLQNTTHAWKHGGATGLIPRRARLPEKGAALLLVRLFATARCTRATVLPARGGDGAQNDIPLHKLLAGVFCRWTNQA